MKRIIGIFFISTLLIGMSYGQSFGSVDNDKQDEEQMAEGDRGFTAQVDLDTNLFQFTDTVYQDAKQRSQRKKTNSFLIDNYPFGGFNVLDDTYAAFGYNGDRFGGNLSVNSGGLGSIKGWINFFNGALTLKAGNDIGYGYADSQGADAGLRVYDDNVRNGNHGQPLANESETTDASKNPDNITQDKGVLFELDFEKLDLAPIKLAFGGGGNIDDFATNIGSVMAASNKDAVYGHSFQYGVNLGGKIAPEGKRFAQFNAAYVYQSVKDETQYEYSTTAKRVIAMYPDSELANHLFGLYASFYPFGDDSLGVTLAYAGVLAQYLEEYSVSSETAMPLVFKNGLNLTARWKNDKLTIKTDHNYSFWTDKNYRIYNFYKPDALKMKDYGLMAKSDPASDVSSVTHSFLWNGVGVIYRFTDVLEGKFYVRNLIRTDSTEEYEMVIDYFSVELESRFYINPSVEAYIGVTYHYTQQDASESLAKEVGEYGTSYTPKATTDYVSMFKFPIGMKIKLQK